MPDFEPSTGVVHRTDASVAALPWRELDDRLASESYYRVEFKQHGSHNVVDLMVFTIREGPRFRLATTVEQSDVRYKRGREIRVLTLGWVTEDAVLFDNLPEAQSAAKIEAVLHHAHTKGFKHE